MKKLLAMGLLFIILFILPLAVSAFEYGADILESGNPGGWYGSSMKTWDEEWTLEAGEAIYVDIWFKDFCPTPSGWLLVDYDPDKISIQNVQLYDGELPGPWHDGTTYQEYYGFGTYFVTIHNDLYVEPDQDGDIILCRIYFIYEGGGNAQITISDLGLGPPCFGIDPQIYPATFTIDERECTIDADCNDGLWCTETDACNDGVCEMTVRDCSAAGDQCNDGVCNENVDSCVKQPKADGPPCDDGLFCNGADSCSGGSCSIHEGDPCEYCTSYGCSCDPRGLCMGCTGDAECDGICNPGETGPFCTGSDNCPGVPNGPNLGSCTSGFCSWYGRNMCMTHSDCGTGGYCSREQEDTVPPGGNGIGDACECEGNFNCDEDTDVDGSDASTLKADFGRNSFQRPCITDDPCNGDFDCDGDLDGTDAARFKEDFGRSPFINPCPACISGGAWCRYEGGPFIKEYSDSGCLGGFLSSTLQEDGCASEDRVAAVVAGSSIFVTNYVSFNCCSGVEVQLSSAGNYLHLLTIENPPGSCFCICCFRVDTEIAGLAPGAYTVEMCWDDWYDGWYCETETVAVP